MASLANIQFRSCPRGSYSHLSVARLCSASQLTLKKSASLSLSSAGQNAHPVQSLLNRRHYCPQRVSKLQATLHFPDLLPFNGPWGVWTALVVAGTLGLWSERTTLGKELSGALVSTLLGLLMANVGLMPTHAPELKIVYKFILPLAVPMLLFSANLRRVLRESGRMLFVFLVGSCMTVFGTVLAMKILPLGNWLGSEGWKIAAALTARHIGGAVNYISVSEALQMSPSLFGAGLAADDVILGLYFITIYTLAKGIPADDGGDTSAAQAPGGHGGAGEKSVQVFPALTAVAVSSAICYLSVQLSSMWGVPDQTLSIITAVTVSLATLLPGKLGSLAPHAEGIAAMLMQVFYVAIGASANVALVMRSAPMLFAFSLIALAAHLGGLILAGRLLGFSMREVLLASNANIGGPSTVAGMASAKGWRSSLVPALLTSTLGYALGTVVGMTLGHRTLKYM